VSRWSDPLPLPQAWRN